MSHSTQHDDGNTSNDAIIDDDDDDDRTICVGLCFFFQFNAINLISWITFMVESSNAFQSFPYRKLSMALNSIIIRDGISNVWDRSLIMLWSDVSVYVCFSCGRLSRYKPEIKIELQSILFREKE